MFTNMQKPVSKATECDTSFVIVAHFSEDLHVRVCVCVCVCVRVCVCVCVRV